MQIAAGYPAAATVASPPLSATYPHSARLRPSFLSEVGLKVAAVAAKNKSRKM